MGDFDGVYPGQLDIIITGRSHQEKHVTLLMLESKGIKNKVYFNPLDFHQKTRVSSGQHKADTIRKLLNNGTVIGIHFEDDPIQADVIRKLVPEIKIVLLQHNLVDKENVWHGE